CMQQSRQRHGPDDLIVWPDQAEMRSANETARVHHSSSWHGSLADRRRRAPAAVGKDQYVHVEDEGTRQHRDREHERSLTASCEEAGDLRCGCLDLDHDRFLNGFYAMQNTLGMAAHVAGAQDVFLRANGGLHLALDHVNDGFMGVCVERSAYTRSIVNFQKGHLIALDERLHEQVSAVCGLALNGIDLDGLHIGVP